MVLDATESMIRGGPSQGSQRGQGMADSRLVVVTEDAIAANVTGVAIIRANGGTLAVPWTLGQITRALALRLPRWLSEQTEFSHSVVGLSEADAAAIMAKCSA